jgi:isopentenyldiphosphate isomerase
MNIIVDNLSEEIALYNEEGKQIGKINRKIAHNSKDFLHGAVHIFVFNSDGKLLLQRRSKRKLIAPDRFDISAGGHIAFGEDEYIAALRELEEELGITGVPLKFLYNYIWESEIEREFVFSYSTIFDGEINFLKSEIEEVRFFDLNEIQENGIFTKNLIYELEILKRFNFISK